MSSTATRENSNYDNPDHTPSLSPSPNLHVPGLWSPNSTLCSSRRGGRSGPLRLVPYPAEKPLRAKLDSEVVALDRVLVRKIHSLAVTFICLHETLQYELC